LVLNLIFDNLLLLGLAQAAATTALVLVVILLSRLQDMHLGRETVIALGRGFVQVVAVGSMLLLLLQGPVWTSVLVLMAMVVAAASMSSQRAQGVPGAFWVSLQSIGLGAGLVIALMTALGVIEAELTALIPVGSMVVAAAMRANSLALDRFRAEVIAHTGQIEAALALGAEPNTTVAAHAQAAIRASLIPSLDSLKSLGIVWIPGMMSGMILSGSDPVYAAIYQFVIIAMIFAVSGLTAAPSVLLIRSWIFSPAEQLILRPGDDGNED
jgi:putative ABC transport system permease protein